MKRPLPLKMLFSLLALAGVLLAAAILLALARVDQAQQQLVEVYERRYQSYLLADELRRNSDELTRMARSYSVIGYRQFEQNYHTILAIREGRHPRPENYERPYWDFVVAGIPKPRPDGPAIALEELMRQAGFTDREFAQLEIAKNNSDGLMRSEMMALHAVKGLFEDAQGNFTVEGESDMQMARQILFDDFYHQMKSHIMAPIDEFFRILDVRTSNEVAAAREASQQAQLILIGVLLFGLLAAAMALFLVYRRIFKMLGGEPGYARYKVECIASGDLTIPIRLKKADQTSLLFAMSAMKDSLARMIGQITDNAINLTQSANQLAETAGLMAHRHSNQDSASHSIAAAVEEMSSSVAEITSTMEQLSASSTQIADHSQSVVDVANRTLESSRQGAGAMQQLLGRMEDIRNDNQKSLAEIVALGNKSKEISKVMDIITTIADQTKLIAFNAALEASSAGDAGRRFSVVASEIRRLADNVTDSTRDIENKIQEIQDAISRLVLASEKGTEIIDGGMAASTHTAHELDALVQAASQTSSAAQKISLSTKQQKTANAQVVQALREIASASATTSQSVRSISDISRSLISMSHNLNELVQQFKLPEDRDAPEDREAVDEKTRQTLIHNDTSHKNIDC